MLTKEKIIEALKKIPDPELQISIWDLGLVYDIRIDEKNDVEILMTLTSIGCPLFSTIEEMVKKEILSIKGVSHVRVELTFEPSWTMERMSPEARATIGI